MSLNVQYKCADNGKIPDLVFIMGPTEMILCDHQETETKFTHLGTLSDSLFFRCIFNTICIKRNALFHTQSPS